jgi:hypothetical protein
MRMKNVSGKTLILTWREGDARIVPPGAEVEIEDGYALPRRKRNGALRQSVVEQLFGSALKPLEAPKARTAEELEEKLEGGPGIPTVEALVAQGHPQGVAEVMVEEAKAAKKKRDRREERKRQLRTLANG